MQILQTKDYFHTYFIKEKKICRGKWTANPYRALDESLKSFSLKNMGGFFALEEFCYFIKRLIASFYNIKLAIFLTWWEAWHWKLWWPESGLELSKQEVMATGSLRVCIKHEASQCCWSTGIGRKGQDLIKCALCIEWRNMQRCVYV